MRCACGHAIDHDTGDGTRKVRTRMVLIKSVPGGEAVCIVCPACSGEVAVQIGGTPALVRDRLPVLFVRSDPRLTRGVGAP